MLLLSTSTSLISTFLFGFHSGVLNQPKDEITLALNLNDFQWGAIISAFLLSGFLSCFFAPFLSISLGRLKSLQIAASFFFIGSLGFSFSNSFFFLLFSRFIIGFGAGSATILTPLYISEISPSNKKGLFGSFSQLSIVLGVFTSQVLGLWFTKEWRNVLFYSAGAPLLQFLLLFFTIESPVWYSSVGLIEKENEALRLLSSGYISLNQEPTDTDIHSDSRNDQVLNIQKPFPTRQLISCIILQIAQQFSGINAITYYSTTIFQLIYPLETAILLTLLLTIVLASTTLLSSFIIDKIGSKRIVTISILIMCVISLIIGTIPNLNISPFQTVLIFNLFVFGFGVGLGSVPWMIIHEILDSDMVAFASSVCCGVNWIGNFIVGLATPIFIGLFGLRLFYWFGIVLAVCLGVLHWSFKVVEGDDDAENRH